MKSLRTAAVVLASLTALTLGMGGKYKKLEDYEKDHYNALKVWFDEEQKDTKRYFKLKTAAERDQWLKDKGYWDRFYKYDEYDRAKILSREPELGWTQDMVYMSWGKPFRKTKTTKRTASTSIILTYRVEVAKDGAHMIWAPDSKETYKAIDRYQADIYLDDRRVTKIVEKENWE